MLKYKILVLFLLAVTIARSQNIYSALQLNQERDYKTKRPKKIIEINTFYNSTGKEIDTIIKKFDDAGMNLTQERHEENGEVIVKSTNVNDTVKRQVLMITTERWSNLGKTTEMSYFTYDSNNFLIAIENKNKNGDTFLKTKIINNDKGDPIELTTFDANGSPYGKEIGTYLYDKNRVVTSVFSNSGKLLSTDTIKISFKIIDPFKDNDETYNDRGDITRYISKNLDGSKTTYQEEYQYDRFGNCIDEKIYIITIKSNGKQKLKLDRDFAKQYFY